MGGAEACDIAGLGMHMRCHTGLVGGVMEPHRVCRLRQALHVGEVGLGRCVCLQCIGVHSDKILLELGIILSSFFGADAGIFPWCTVLTCFHCDLWKLIPAINCSLAAVHSDTHRAAGSFAAGGRSLVQQSGTAQCS